MTKMINALAAMAVCAATPALAAEHIVNGGFEPGGGAGWMTAQDGTSWGFDFDPSRARSGDGSALTYRSGPDALYNNELYQDVAVTAGQAYNLSFWWRNNYIGWNDGQGTPGVEDEQLRVVWGGVELGVLAYEGTDWKEFSFNNIIATGNVMRLSFFGRNDPGDTYLDDVSLTDATFTVPPDGDPVAVPEPAAWALMILGFGAAGAVLRRQRATFAAFYAS